MRRMATIALTTAIGLVASSAALQAGEAKMPVTLTPAQLKWVPNPGATGVLMAVVWGDPDKGPFGAFNKFSAGFVAPLHTHTANTKVVVLSGTMVMVSEDGTEMKFPAGSYYEQPNTYKHATKCDPASECLAYVTADGKWDLKPVETKKK